MRAAVTAFIGLGSNLAAPVLQLRSAINELRWWLADTELTACSGLYRSKPMGPADQPDYCNAVVRVQSRLSAPALLTRLLALEALHGRMRQRKWGARTLDLDLLLYGDQSINTPSLVVPHPGIRERPFVLAPLAEIAPDCYIPRQGAVATLLAQSTADALIYLGDPMPGCTLSALPNPAQSAVQRVP